MTFFALSSVPDNVLRSEAPKLIKSLKMVRFTNFFFVYTPSYKPIIYDQKYKKMRCDPSTHVHFHGGFIAIHLYFCYFTLLIT